ncbi:MAG TPA: tetratricopeptide repeat protein [Bryobacteraceae bacterium]|nr:tetratricopeptide repeat protein [Bryobacteraceae bacterium]
MRPCLCALLLLVLGLATAQSQEEAALRKAIAAGEDTAAAHGRLGLLLYHAGRFAEATVELGRAAQLDPAKSEYSLKLAGSILAEQRYSVALEFLKAIEARFKGLAEYQYNLGLAYYGTRDYPNAIAAFEGALRIEPGMDLAYFFLGNTYAVSGELDKALPYYRKAIGLNPRNPGYYLSLGKVLAAIGPEKDAEAIRLFRKSLELHPGDSAAEYALASACMRTGDFACARPLLERVTARHPDELSAHVLLSRLYAGVGEPEKAAAERETVKRLQRAKQQAKMPRAEPQP